MKRIVLGIALVLAAGAAHAQAPVADYYSLNSTMNGTALTAGMTIEAYDGDGILCGSAIVNLDGGFLMHVYGNDPLTAAIDEGATQGEFLHWRIDGIDLLDADALWIANLVGSFNDARWENGAAKEIRLSATTSAIEAQSWSAVKDRFRP